MGGLGHSHGWGGGYDGKEQNEVKPDRVMELAGKAMWVGEVWLQVEYSVDSKGYWVAWDCKKVEQIAEGQHARLERRERPVWNALRATDWHSGVRLGRGAKGYSPVCHGGPEEELRSLEEYLQHGSSLVVAMIQS